MKGFSKFLFAAIFCSCFTKACNLCFLAEELAHSSGFHGLELYFLEKHMTKIHKPSKHVVLKTIDVTSSPLPFVSLLL